MAFPISVFRAQVDNNLGAKTDTDILDNLSRHRHIKAALETYSQDMPDTYTEDESGDGGRYYPLTGVDAVLANWQDDFSQVTAIEYPAQAVSADESPIYLDSEDWRDDYDVAGVTYLFLPNHAPASDETMRVTFTVPYNWTESGVTTAVEQVGHGFSDEDYIYQDGSTWYAADEQRVATHIVESVTDSDNFTAAELQADVPVAHFFAICDLATAYCCEAIATGYSNTSDSTITADSVNHPTRAAEFAKRARAFETKYRAALGLDADSEKSERAASAFADWDTEPTFPHGRRYLYHRRR